MPPCQIRPYVQESIRDCPSNGGSGMECLRLESSKSEKLQHVRNTGTTPVTSQKPQFSACYRESEYMLFNVRNSSVEPLLISVCRTFDGSRHRCNQVHHQSTDLPPPLVQGEGTADETYYN